MIRAEQIDIISPAERLRVDKQAGYKEVYDISDLGDNDWITVAMTRNIYNPPDPIVVDIPTNSAGFYDFAYDGSLGEIPDVILQIRISSPSLGWQTYSQGAILDNGHAYVTGDFSLDTYRLVIKP